MRRVLPTVAVIAAAIVVLLIGSRFLWTGTFHTYALDHSLNDQAGYVTTARHLADSCRYESSLYYPAKLLYYKEHNLPYMPGNYYIRAAFIKILGYSVFIAILPNLIAFVLSAVLVYHIARELYDVKTAAAAVIAFLVYPPYVLYAYTAMMELVFTGACLMAVYGFIKTPQRLRHIIVPFLVIPAFLIRETAIFLVPGFAAWLYYSADAGKFRKVLIFAGITVLAVLALGQLPHVAHRPPTLYARLFNSSAMHYFDAYALQQVHVDLMGTIQLIWNHCLDNIRIFFLLLFREVWPGGLGYFVGVLAMLLACIVMLYVAKPREKAFLLFLVITSVSLLAAILLLYDYYSYTGLRLFMFMVPLYMCVLAAHLVSSRIVEESVGVVVASLILCAVGGIFLYRSLDRFESNFLASDAHAKRCASFFDSLGVAGTPFFIAPHEIALDYVVSHYPIGWSFVPHNEATLSLLTDRFPVSVLVVPADHPLVRGSRQGEMRQSLAGGRLILEAPRTFGRASLLVYRRPLQLPASVTPP